MPTTRRQASVKARSSVAAAALPREELAHELKALPVMLQKYRWGSGVDGTGVVVTQTMLPPVAREPAAFS